MLNLKIFVLDHTAMKGQIDFLLQASYRYAKPHNLLAILRESKTRIISIYASIANPYHYI